MNEATTYTANGQSFQLGIDIDPMCRSRPDEDMAVLRQRLTTDGYLYLAGFEEPSEVLAARRDIVERMHAHGCIDAADPMAAVHIAGKNMPAIKQDQLLQLPAYRRLVDGQRRLDFFSRLLDGKSMTLDHKWLRMQRPGFAGAPAHYDIVYMGEGTKDLYTVWTPLGDVDYDCSPLMVLPGSHRCQDLIESYGQTNTHHGTPGSFTRDLRAASRLTGCRWATTAYQAGDILIFGMYLMHASLANTSDHVRISTDTRYQRQDQAIDPRHMGALDVQPTPGEWLVTHGQGLL